MAYFVTRYKSALKSLSDYIASLIHPSSDTTSIFRSTASFRNFRIIRPDFNQNKPYSDFWRVQIFVLRPHLRG